MTATKKKTYVNNLVVLMLVLSGLPRCSKRSARQTVPIRSRRISETIRRSRP